MRTVIITAFLLLFNSSLHAESSLVDSALEGAAQEAGRRIMSGLFDRLTQVPASEENSLQSGLYICVKGGSLGPGDQSLAVAQKNSDGTFTTHGWYHAKAGFCTGILKELTKRYYYITTTGNITSSSDKDFFKIEEDAKNFMIYDSESSRGYSNSKRFREIDTGSDPLYVIGIR